MVGHICNKKELSVLVTREEDEGKMDDKRVEGDKGEVASARDLLMIGIDFRIQKPSK